MSIADKIKLYVSLLSYMLGHPGQSPALVTQLFLDSMTRFHKKSVTRYGACVRHAEEALRALADESHRTSLSLFELPGDFEQEVMRLASSDRGYIPPEWDADLTLARVAYHVCRLVAPDVTIETGVAHGITSAFILKALAENGKGHLYSIDLPVFKRGSEDFVGVAVPQRLRDRWKLTLGLSRNVLPRLLSQLGKIDVFLHDSNHSYHNQLLEYRMAWQYLRLGGMLLSDDVNATDAFWDFTQQQGVTPICLTQATKTLLIGLVPKHGF